MFKTPRTSVVTSTQLEHNFLPAPNQSLKPEACRDTLPAIITMETDVAKKKPHFTLRTHFPDESFLPPINTSKTCTPQNSHIPAKLDLVSASTYSLFSQSTSSSPQLQQDLMVDYDLTFAHLEPYIRASLRSDFTAGYPFLSFLRKIKADYRAANYLLFWQSIEIILTQDEMKRWYTTCSRGLPGKIPLRDPSKPCPYLSHFEQCLVAKDLQELCQLFLDPKGIHWVELPENVEEELRTLLPRGLGQGLLLATQEYVVKVGWKV